VRVASRSTMVYKALDLGPSLYKPFFDYMHRELKSAENRMLFSRVIEKLFPQQFKMSDVDSVLFKIERNKFGNVIDEKPIAFFELKRKSWRVAREAWANGEIEVNGKQFMRLRRLAKMFNVPYYYFMQVGNYFVVFNVLSVDPSFEVRHENDARDLYAVIPKEEVIVARSVEDLRTDLRILLEKGGL